MVFVYLKNLILPLTPPPKYANPRKSRKSPIPTAVENDASFINTLHPSLTDAEITSDSEHSDDPFLNEKDGSSAINGHEPLKAFARIDPRVVSDAIIGLSDGLTVPFALTAGLSAFGSTKVVIFGGLAELIAGAISMGLGGYLAARSEAEAYHALSTSTTNLVYNRPAEAASLIRTALADNIPSLSSAPTPPAALAAHIQQHSTPAQLTDFLLAFHHKATPPSDSRSALFSAATIASGYFVGGFVPLLPYFFAAGIGRAFWWSVAVMAVALFAFGAGRTWAVCGCVEGGFGREGWEVDEEDEEEHAQEGRLWSRRRRRRRSLVSLRGVWKCACGGVQMVVLGGVGAAAAMGLVKAFS